MRITYDSLADALYVQFVEPAKPVSTRHLAEGIAADYDARGRLAGLEILDVAHRCGRATLKMVTLEEIGLSH